jgi:hypothetical protein
LASAPIAIPVIGATSAYVASEMLGWGGGIDKKFWHAKKFYITLVAVLLVGTAVALEGDRPQSHDAKNTESNSTRIWLDRNWRGDGRSGDLPISVFCGCMIEFQLHPNQRQYQ